MFQDELDFFKMNQPTLVGQYSGKILVIKGSEVIGAYNTALEAYTATIKKHEPGSFMIQPCQPGPEAYTVTISSREVFLV